MEKDPETGKVIVKGNPFGRCFRHPPQVTVGVFVPHETMDGALVAIPKGEYPITNQSNEACGDIIPKANTG